MQLSIRQVWKNNRNKLLLLTESYILSHLEEEFYNEPVYPMIKIYSEAYRGDLGSIYISDIITYMVAVGMTKRYITFRVRFLFIRGKESVNKQLTFTIEAETKEKLNSEGQKVLFECLDQNYATSEFYLRIYLLKTEVK
jgi:hypothetical protein